MKFMCEMMTVEKIEKIKSPSVDVIVEMIEGKPYYSIKYYDLSDHKIHIGYSSYKLDVVFGYLDKYFEKVEIGTKSERNFGDLISRKALMEKIDSLYMRIIGLRAGKGYILKIMEEYKKLVLKCIDEAQTAYDVDSVCEEIKYIFKKELDLLLEKEMNEDDSSEKIELILNLNSEIHKIVRNGGKKQ